MVSAIPFNLPSPLPTRLPHPQLPPTLTTIVTRTVRFSVVLLHQNPKDTAKSVSFGFLCSRQGSDPRVLGTPSVTANICSITAGSVMKDSRAGSAAAQPTLSPPPSPERNDRLANLYPSSDIYPYGEAPLVSTKIRRKKPGRCRARVVGKRVPTMLRSCRNLRLYII